MPCEPASHQVLLGLTRGHPRTTRAALDELRDIGVELAGTTAGSAG